MKLHKSVSLQLKEYLLIAAFLLTLGSCGENEPTDPADSPKNLSQAELFDLQKALDNSLYFHIPPEVLESIDLYGYDIWHSGCATVFFGNHNDFLHITSLTEKADLWSMTTMRPVFLISSEGGDFSLNSYYLTDSKKEPRHLDFKIADISAIGIEPEEGFGITASETMAEYEEASTEITAYEYGDGNKEDYHQLMRVKIKPNLTSKARIYIIQLITPDQWPSTPNQKEFVKTKITFYQKGTNPDISIDDLMNYFR